MERIQSGVKPESDYDLVLLAVNDNNERAFSELMSRYRNSVYHTMLKMVKNKEDADDLTLEAFGKAFRKLDSYTPKFAFSTWLFKIAINNCIDHIRKKKLKLLSIDNTHDDEGGSSYSNQLKSSALDPEEVYIRQQKLKLMRKMLRNLNLKYRLMIEMRYFEEMSYEHISRELELPLGTVKAQLFRAKEILWEMLESDGAKDHLDMPSRRKRR